MIYFYKHKTMGELSQEEYDMLGMDGIIKFARERNVSPVEIFTKIKNLEDKLKTINEPPFDVSTGDGLKLLNKCLNEYIDYFNHNAKYHKQAYVLIGNIASGKSTYAKQIEQETGSIIVDPDRYKMGEETEFGYFEGLTSLYEQPTDRERMQDACSIASKLTLKKISNYGMNLILPKTTSSFEKLEQQLQVLTNKNYDIHLILVDAPITDCANRNYYRYLIKEYSSETTLNNGDYAHGRFVPLSVITNIGDNTFTTFANAYKHGKIKYKSFKAFYNDDSMQDSDEIDISTMQMNL